MENYSIQNEFVSQEQSIKLQKLGFDFDVFQRFSNANVEDFIKQPLKQQVFRWFREKHNLNHTIELTDNSRSYHYEFMILDSKNREYHDEDCFDQAKRLYNKLEFRTYEEAENECINHIISLIEAKN